ncbi:hypothetical protein Tco_0680761, partial [Tanacetum coccineum]
MILIKLPTHHHIPTRFRPTNVIAFIVKIYGNNPNPNSLNDSPNISENVSQSPLLIDHHCCYECGYSLDDIFCQRCTCKSCGNGAHYGYNYPPKVLIISNPEPCNNQTVDELPQTLPSFNPTCNSGDGNSFTYDSTPNFVNDSPNVFNPPPQPEYVSYSWELCGNDIHHGYDCPPRVPFVYNQDPCINQNFDYFPQTSPSFLQQYPYREDCGCPHETFQCQPMNYYEPNSCYDSNYFGFDQFQPPQYTVNHPIFNAQNELLNYQNEIMEQMTSICDMVGKFYSLERYIISGLPPCVAITPILLIEEPVESLIMKDEHIDTIPATESDEVIKSSVENLVPILSESEDAFDDVCDLPVCDDFPKSHLVSFSNPLFDINDDCTSSDDESFSEEDVPMENFKFFSNPLFDLDEEIVSTEVNLIQNEVLESITSIPRGIDSFYAESNLIESLLNQNTLIDSTSKIDSILDEFAGEITLLKSIPPGEIHLVERLLCDNSSPLPPKELNVEISIESFSLSPIPVEDSDSLMEEIDLFLPPDDSIPPGIENDDYDSEGDIIFLEELLRNDSSSLPENESFHFNIPSSPRPHVKPPDDG